MSNNGRAKATVALLAGLAFYATAFGASATVVTYNDLTTFQSATSSLTLIDFDTDTTGTPTVGGAQIGNTYSSLGIAFPAGNTFADDFTGPVSPPNGWINDTARFFDAVFAIGGVTAVGVHNVLFAGVSSLQAFDAADNLIGSVLSDALDSTKDFFGLTTTTPIARFTVTITGGGWGLDELYFGQAGDGTETDVAEPGPLSLIGLALAGLGLLSLRRTAA